MRRTSEGLMRTVISLEAVEVTVEGLDGVWSGEECQAADVYQVPDTW